MSVPQRHVLAWDEAFLAAAVSWLVEGWDGRAPLDLSNVWVMVSSRQAGRRLREALAARAAERGQAVFAPRVSSPQVPDVGVSGRLPVASRTEVVLAWVSVFQALDLSEVTAVIPKPPPERSLAWALRMAREMAGVQERLSENALRIAGVCAGAGEDFPERDRWEQLAGMELRYDAALAGAGLADPLVARIHTAEAGTAPESVRRVVLLGVLDASPLLARWLAALPEPIRVDVVVAGPDGDGAMQFDGWGRPVAAYWSARALELSPFQERVHLCADPTRQAALVTGCLTDCATADHAPAVGVADPQVTPLVESALAAKGWVGYDPAGRAYRECGLYHVLSTIHAWIQEPSYSALAAVARCADVLHWLEVDMQDAGSTVGWLAGLDEVHGDHLPESMEDVWVQVRSPHSVLRGKQAVDAGLGRLRELHQAVSRLPFPENIQHVLTTLYGERRFAANDPDEAGFIEAAQAWRAAVTEVSRALGRFPGLSATDAWELALRVFGDGVRFADKPDGAVELQGWIELLWEDAPHLVVAGLNEGFVPESVVGDAFLPEGLRQRLGLRTNVDKLARDACLFDTLAAMRRRTGRLDVLLGKFSVEGEPLRPSRLLLRCDDAVLAERVRWLFRPVEAMEEGGTWQRPWRLRPRTNVAVRRVAVTGFRTYLKCPFRFYLRHALRMESVDPFKTELDSRDFGHLCHGALEAMGRDPLMAACTDVEVLRAFLLDRLEATAADRYGSILPVPLQVQLESARQRLRKAAEVQVDAVQAGWRIERVESVFTFLIGGLEVKGKIDRIDRHSETGRVRVLDYKTSDAPVSPLEAHVRKPRRDEDLTALPPWRVVDTGDGPRLWTDLQIPLYLRALRGEFGADMECGYFNLPKAVGETSIQTWEGWNPAWADAAEACAHGLATLIRAGVFWPPTELAPGVVDDYAALFHRGVAESVDWREAPSEEEAGLL